ncbi:MAG: hypothetical protein HQK74_09520 [Desulfamplus sp.]|nr:hypothetical protein [Desulfamplus sp.]
MGHEDVIRLYHLQPHFSELSAKDIDFKEPKPTFTKSPNPPLSESNSYCATNKKDEAEIVHKALLKHRGNIARTAKSLGISRQLLYYKIKRYNLKRNDYAK